MTMSVGSQSLLDSHRGVRRDRDDAVFRIAALSGSTSPTSPTGLLETLLKSAAHAILTMDRSGLITGWNAGACLILGWSADQMLGQSATQIFTADDNERGVLALTLGAAHRLGHVTAERPFLRKDGSTIWGGSEVLPLSDASGRRPGFLMILSDRSQARVAAETHRLEAEKLRRTFTALADGLSVLDLDGSLVPGDDDLGPLRRPGLPICADRNKPDVLAALRAARDGGTGRFLTTEPWENRHWDVTVTPVLGADGKPERLLAVSRDISDLMRTEQLHGLLTQELAHRVKNTFAMIKAIASQTLVGKTMPTGLRDDFDSRLMALSHAHDMLVQGNWTSAKLRPLVDGIARLHGLAHSERFRIAGSDVTLGPRMALAFALVFHELGTNAIKYGALSNASGRVTVSWSVEESPEGPLFGLRWEETGGPVVTPPARKGFGSRLIAHSFRPGGGVSSAITYEPEGLAFTVTMPMATIEQP